MTPRQEPYKAREVAEKIYEELDKRDLRLAPSEVGMIEALISEAINEAVLESRKADDRVLLDHRTCYEKDLKEARAAAISECAEIARRYRGTELKPYYDWVSAREGIARAIEAAEIRGLAK